MEKTLFLAVLISALLVPAVSSIKDFQIRLPDSSTNLTKELYCLNSTHAITSVLFTNGTSYAYNFTEDCQLGCDIAKGMCKELRPVGFPEVAVSVCLIVASLMFFWLSESKRTQGSKELETVFRFVGFVLFICDLFFLLVFTSEAGYPSTVTFLLSAMIWLSVMFLAYVSMADVTTLMHLWDLQKYTDTELRRYKRHDKQK